MTPKEMADKLTPEVREASEKAKPDLLASLPPLQRPFVKAGWNQAMKYGVPFETQVAIEFLINKYRQDIEPIVGDYVKLLIPALEEENDERLKIIHDWLALVSTPENQFHPTVRATLNPNDDHTPKDYDEQ